MDKKILTRFNVKQEYLVLIDSEADARGLSKHEYLNHILYEYMIKQQNRLSNHVVREVENLVLMLLTSSERYENIQEVYKQSILIDIQKRELLHEQKNSKKEKTFWRKILIELRPQEFKNIKTQSDANEKISTLYKIVKEHREVFQ